MDEEIVFTKKNVFKIQRKFLSKDYILWAWILELKSVKQILWLMFILNPNKKYTAFKKGKIYILEDSMKCPTCWRKMQGYYARRFGMCKYCLESKKK